MAKSTAERQRDYRSRHINKDKARVQLVLAKEVAAQLDHLCDSYSLTKQAIIEKLITTDWQRLSAGRPKEEAGKKAAMPKRGLATNRTGKAKEVKP